MDYANWAPRAIGYLIDSTLVMLLMGVLYGIGAVVMAGLAGTAGSVGGGSDVVAGLSATICCMMVGTFPLAILLVGIWNRCYLVSTRGYSIGQGVMKLKVVDHNGQLLTFGNALLRLLAHVGLTMVAFGTILDALWPLWDPRRQTLHDKAVNCYVINRP
jgi:uncharacterized RDD family membrane protein YckC